MNARVLNRAALAGIAFVLAALLLAATPAREIDTDSPVRLGMTVEEFRAAMASASVLNEVPGGKFHAFGTLADLGGEQLEAFVFFDKGRLKLVDFVTSYGQTRPIGGPQIEWDEPCEGRFSSLLDTLRERWGRPADRKETSEAIDQKWITPHRFARVSVRGIHGQCDFKAVVFDGTEKEFAAFEQEWKASASSPAAAKTGQ